jgi:uncharacterized protein
MSKLNVRQSKHEGLGVIAGRNYKQGQIITEISGNVIHWRTVIAIGGVIQDNTFRFSDQYYLSPDGLGNYINHSCEPNAGIFKSHNRLYLKAISPIARGEEIVFDYSTIIGNDDSWTMKCGCGSRLCRKTVKNFGSLPKPLQSKYLALGIVPDYILNAK